MNNIAREFLAKRNARVASGSPIKTKTPEPNWKPAKSKATINRLKK